MRTLKFRAWVDGKMHVQPIASPFCVHRFFGLIPDDASVMQFTGLKDKNGVEIYEGDLIVAKHYPFYGDAPEIKNSDGECKELNYIGEVYFDDENDFTYAYGMHAVSNRVRGCACGDVLSAYDDFEVIGNIYESPELLNT